MKEQPLVTMITYCYNGERFVHKYFDAILSQTYKNIELIFFINGCEDNTADVVAKYVPQLEKKGVKCIIIERSPNNPKTCQLKVEAIKMMKGKYFFGCDSDDLLHSDYIEKMVDFLENNPDKGLVYCQLNRVNEADGKTLSILKPYKQTFEGEGFNNIIRCKNTIFPAISYMMSTKWLDKINPSRDFYVSNFGENIQIQMPFLFYNLQGYVDEVLGDYIVRTDSFSNTIDLDKKMKILDEEDAIISASLMNLGKEVYNDYNLISQKRIAVDKFYIALKIDNRNMIDECYKRLKELNICSSKERIEYLASKNTFYKKILYSIKKLK